jgi:hypothetical protein
MDDADKRDEAQRLHDEEAALLIHHGAARTTPGDDE